MSAYRHRKPFGLTAANFVIRLVQDLGHEADITDEIAGVPIHFNGIYEQGGLQT
jgi:hypothetical protein